MKKLTLILLAFTLVIACKNDKKEDQETSHDEEIKVEEKITDEVETIMISLNAKSDSNVSGTATFTQTNGSVSMIAKMEGLTEGKHAIHIHEKADCTSPDGKSTGGHWNPTAKPHGKWGNETGYHKGDIGNFSANANGNAKITFTTDEWCIGCGDESKDIVGKAIIVHQGIDDFTSQPSGAAGSRVSCGGIIQ